MTYRIDLKKKERQTSFKATQLQHGTRSDALYNTNSMRSNALLSSTYFPKVFEKLSHDKTANALGHTTQGEINTSFDGT